LSVLARVLGNPITLSSTGTEGGPQMVMKLKP
jgi:hypothetical protein